MFTREPNESLWTDYLCLPYAELLTARLVYVEVMNEITTITRSARSA